MLHPIKAPVLQPGVHNETLVIRGDAPELDFDAETKSRLKSFADIFLLLILYFLFEHLL
ncbi:hypothetical protein PB1E_0949 [Leuconostoc gelidum subsp. gasicomitatum]|nr:hypothetical protein PB1E_0949 [Leuconostoc gasicomitatum]